MKFAVVFCCVGWLFCSSIASAGSFKIVKSAASPLSELTIQDPTAAGVVNRFAPPANSVLLLVEFEVAAVLGKEEDSVSLHLDSFGVYDGNTKLPLIFDFTRLSGDTVYFSMNFFRGGDEPVENQLHRVMVIAPAKKNEFTLRMSAEVTDPNTGESKPGKPVEAALKADAKPKPFAYGDYVSLQVGAMKFVDSLPRKSVVNDIAYSTVNPGGSILAVEVKLTAKATFLSPDGLVDFNSSAIGLTFGKGGSCACLGYSYAKQNQTGDVYSGSLRLGGGDKYSNYSGKPLIFYFPIPSNLRAFSLTFGGQAQQAVEIPANVKP